MIKADSVPKCPFKGGTPPFDISTKVSAQRCQNHTGINHRIRSNQHLTGEDHSIRNPLTIGSLFICQGLTYIRGENWASLGKERSLALSNEGRKLPLVKASFPRPRQAKRRLPKTGAALLDGTVAVPLIFIVPVHAFVVVPQVLWEV
jgi:hypothetical protein